ncbi:MAG: excinuclease ABC subunit UvrA [Paludibacteraceae bacterium]|nr:excinuclease ABC subunit UvrA [Paludibacteraceae bacterium]
MEQSDYISVCGAREHNLKNVSVQIPHKSLTVITGLSGSGKSSLAFDTIYAEGQRRYIETFSAYARQFLAGGERPDVDQITGLNPVIAIQQKTTNNNPRSTVGTTTEIYDYMRLLFARASEAYSYVTGEKMVKYTEEQIVDLLMKSCDGKKVYILSPLVRSRKGHYRELFESLRKKGYLNVRIDGKLEQIQPMMRLDRYKTHDIELVIDRLEITPNEEARIRRSVKTGLDSGDGVIMVIEKDNTDKVHYFSSRLMCPTSGISYDTPAPNDFSFNSPKGCCRKCHGTGFITQVDIDKIFPNKNLSIKDGAIAPLGKQKSMPIFTQIATLCENFGCTIETPVKELPEELLDIIINGSEDRVVIKSPVEGVSGYATTYNGIAQYINIEDTEASATERKWAEQFSQTIVCPECGGSRLKKEALYYRIAGKNIVELSNMDIVTLYDWFNKLEPELNANQKKIARPIVSEIIKRLRFLIDVGLGYLQLSRASASLSGGESQRIRLATQIGSQLVNVLYILDEPSIGLHPRDNTKLISSLKALRDIGNTVIVVEHDMEMMLSADYIVDMGPKAGRLGGNVVFAGTLAEMLKSDTLTTRYLTGKVKIDVPEQRRKGNGQTLKIYGATGNNLKNVDAEFPLGKFICITGVSGSGKSSLINATLQRAISKTFYHSLAEPLPYREISGLENIDKIIAVDQSPIGRTPRSNPATYIGIFTDIRDLFVALPESKIRGYKAGRFSFNVKGGRCPECGGNGYKCLEMGFMSNVYVPCPVCRGKRYNRETLEVRYKGKSIGDVLDMTFNQAVEFFENIPMLLHKLKVVQSVGLGYLKLGQPSNTLSGGENQRVKLAAELIKRDTGKTLYILDEPTTGLHFEDINILLGVLDRLVNRGNTLIVIEHNIDVIRHADHIIDMGPEGGSAGGQILCTGTPEEIKKLGIGETCKYV